MQARPDSSAPQTYRTPWARSNANRESLIWRQECNYVAWSAPEGHSNVEARRYLSSGPRARDARGHPRPLLAMPQCERGMLRSAGWLVSMLPDRWSWPPLVMPPAGRRSAAGTAAARARPWRRGGCEAAPRDEFAVAVRSQGHDQP